MEVIRLSVPSKPEYVQTLRLVTASVANRLHFDIEAVDDLRVCVSEAVNGRIVLSGSVDVVFEADEDELRIRILGGRDRTGDEEGDDLSTMILQSLLDDVEETGDCLVLVKRRRD